MPEGYQVDPATLEHVTSSLRTAGSTLDGLDSDPGAPDAGELTGPMSALLSRFLSDTGELVTGVGAAGDQVADARNLYLKQDETTTHNLQFR
jgi:hypothetical protein